MNITDERWGLFVDFAATLQSHLTDVQAELRDAPTTEITPLTLEEFLKKFERNWNKLQLSLSAFRDASDALSSATGMTPEQVIMLASTVESVEKLAAQTDETLRDFFHRTGLSDFLPSRWGSGEDLWEIQ